MREVLVFLPAVFSPQSGSAFFWEKHSKKSLHVVLGRVCGITVPSSGNKPFRVLGDLVSFATGSSVWTRAELEVKSRSCSLYGRTGQSSAPDLIPPTPPRGYIMVHGGRINSPECCSGGLEAFLGILLAVQC